MTNIIVILIILAIITGAITKVIIEKRNGAKCIGCPHGKAGSSGCSCKE